MTSHSKSTIQEKHKWLAKHPEMAEWSKKEIVKAMQKAGLVSTKTYYLDVHLPEGWEKK